MESRLNTLNFSGRDALNLPHKTFGGIKETKKLNYLGGDVR